jgi:hypothetical protein
MQAKINNQALQIEALENNLLAFTEMASQQALKQYRIDELEVTIKKQARKHKVNTENRRREYEHEIRIFRGQFDRNMATIEDLKAKISDLEGYGPDQGPVNPGPVS